MRESESYLTTLLTACRCYTLSHPIPPRQYGQTGSGKTFTMEGSESSPGINFRALDHLFKTRDERSPDGVTYEISVAMLEIYNEVRVYVCVVVLPVEVVCPLDCVLTPYPPPLHVILSRRSAICSASVAPTACPSRRAS